MSLPPLQIGRLSAPLPIIQGGMGIGISLSGLAAAVANAGGIGVIATAGIGHDEPDFTTNHMEANSRALARHIRLAKEATDGVVGVNIMAALTNFEELVEVAVREGADIIFSGAGLPLSLPKLVGGGGPMLAPIVSSARAASIICRKWSSSHGRLPDAVVVEGPMAGGHLGLKREEIDSESHRLERLVPEVVKALEPFTTATGTPIPVIAAGGIYSGADIRKFLNLGAAGVQMGTRFVATKECDAHENFKQSYVDARQEDLVIIESPVGLPARAIRKSLVCQVENDEIKPFGCVYRCLKGCDFKKSPYCITKALINARLGHPDEALTFAGANAYRVDSIVTVKELMDSLVAEYEASGPRPQTVPERIHGLATGPAQRPGGMLSVPLPDSPKESFPLE